MNASDFKAGDRVVYVPFDGCPSSQWEHRTVSSMITILLPQCGHCKRFRDRQGLYHTCLPLALLVEQGASPWPVTTGVCPSCLDDIQARDLGEPSLVLKRLDSGESPSTLPAYE